MTADDRRLRTIAALRPYIERARTFCGWSFEHVRQKPLGEGPPWDYEAIARAQARRASSLLDLGTGGGEVLARIVDGLGVRVAATEEWHVNAPVARARLAPLGASVLRASSLQLPFGDASFGLVLSRHEAIDPVEVMRVLRPGGRFITQQVGHDNWREITAFFPRRTDFGDHYSAYANAFAAAGFEVTSQQHERRVAYRTLGDFVFMLLVAPWEIPGFSPAAEIDQLIAMEDALGGPDGLVVTEARYLIVACHSGRR